MSSSEQKVYVGIDVSNDWLDVAVRPSGEQWRVDQDEDGISSLVKRLTQLRPELIGKEATGGPERLAATALGAAELPVAAVNPRHVRDFARSQGILAKTDRLDAAVIAHFGEVSKVVAKPLAPQEARELEALVARRRQAVQTRNAEMNRRHQGHGSGPSPDRPGHRHAGTGVQRHRHQSDKPASTVVSVEGERGPTAQCAGSGPQADVQIVG